MTDGNVVYSFGNLTEEHRGESVVLQYSERGIWGNLKDGAEIERKVVKWHVAVQIAGMNFQTRLNMGGNNFGRYQKASEIFNGHHWWLAAIKTGLEKVSIRIKNDSN